MKGKYLMDPKVRAPHYVNTQDDESEDSDYSQSDTCQFFKPKEVDWRSIKKLNLKKLKQDDDKLRSLANNLKAVNITTKDITNTNPKNITKLFQIYQLIISKLAECKEIVREQVVDKEGKYYECSVCRGKRFISNEYLQAHYDRRHPDYKENDRSEIDLCSERIDGNVCVDESLNFRDSLDYMKACPNELRSSIFSKKGEARVQEIKDMLSNITSTIVEKTIPKSGSNFPNTLPLNKPLLVLNPHSTNKERGGYLK